MKTFVNYFILFVSIVLAISCATMGSPDGGPKDKNAPKIESIDPENLSTNFRSKEVVIQFDEFVKLNKLKDQLFISPPINADLNVRVKGKGIAFDIPIDSLAENTTYSILFGNAVVDVNENNPYPNLNYIFSTGPKLDSLAISGNVINAWTGISSKKPYVVWLFRSENDSALFKLNPNYVTNADANGDFDITHISPGTYSVYGFEDIDGNGKYNAQEEPLAFLDSAITLAGELFKEVVDTVQTDSIPVNKTKVYGYNINLKGSIQAPKKEPQDLLSKKIIDRRQIELIFKNKNTKLPKFEILNNDKQSNWGIINSSKNNDTINIWFNDSTLIKSDTIHLVYENVLPDNTTIIDTLLFRNPIAKRRSKKGQSTKIDPMPFKTNITNGSVVKHTSIFEWTFDVPILKLDEKFLQAFVRIDTSWIPIKTNFNKDSNDYRRLQFTGPFQPEKQYLISLDSGFVTNLYKQVMTDKEIRFGTKSLEDFGNLTLDLKGIDGPIVLQLLDEKNSVIKEIKTMKDAIISFVHLNPGKYRFRLIDDLNNNGKWDSGNLTMKRQPEKVYYYNLPQDIRENWDLTQEWLFKR